MINSMRDEGRNVEYNRVECGITHNQGRDWFVSWMTNSENTRIVYRQVQFDRIRYERTSCYEEILGKAVFHSTIPRRT